jgi:predicted branched-subunit amino acid permease
MPDAPPDNSLPAAPPAGAHAPHPFTWTGVWRGYVAGLPMSIGTGFFGVAFGVVASDSHMSGIEATLMSAAMFAGTAQLAVLKIWATSMALAPMVLVVLATNARYTLFGAAWRPWLAGLPARQAYGTLFFLCDTGWVLAMREWWAGGRDAGFALGAGLVIYTTWVPGTLIGYVLGRSLGVPAALGLDFLLVAFCAAVAIGNWRGRRDALIVAGAALVAVVLERLVPGGWHIVAAGLAGGCIGAWRHDARA